MMQNSRRRVSLAGKWNYLPDQYRGGENRCFWKAVPPSHVVPGRNPVDHDTSGIATVEVPGSYALQVPELRHFDQHLWYYRRFDAPPLRKGERAFLCFEGSYYRTRAWLNEFDLGDSSSAALVDAFRASLNESAAARRVKGQAPAKRGFRDGHMGGFTPFEFEITAHLKRKNNLLAVLTDAAREAERAPTTVTDWFTYGGLTRDVFIEIRPARHITGWTAQLSRDGREIRGEVGATHAGTATLEIPGLDLRQSMAVPSGKAGSFRFKAPARLTRWSPDNPKLYRVIATFGQDRLEEAIGFRTIETRGGEFILNGRPIFLKGICVHEDHIKRGRTLNDADRGDIFREAKALGCNFLRLAHYPHSRRMAEMADREGILLWEEVPVYWNIQWGNRDTWRDAGSQLCELILRDRNRASVIIWSVANETNPAHKGRTLFLKNLALLAKRLDPTRLTTAAQFKAQEGNKLVVNDPLTPYLDVIGVNQYGGWYGPEANMDSMAGFDNIHYPDKPVIMSEFGAGARAGHRGRHKFTEDYQARVYSHQLAAMRRARGIAGLTPWILFDFRCPNRQNSHQRGFNIKGLVDADRKTRKLAFEVYRRFSP